MAALDLTEYTQPLARTPDLLRAAVTGVDDAWLDRRHADDVVSPREAVAHLLLTEAEDSWIDRLRDLLEPDYAYVPGRYAEMDDAQLAASRSLPDLLDEFAAVRQANLRSLEGMRLTEEDLDRSRPADDHAGATIGQMLATWVAHDLYHLGQIYKSYAAPYVDRIGPYQRFLNLPHFN